VHEDLPLNSGDKRTGHCIMTMYHLTLPFLPGEFSTKNRSVIPHPHYSTDLDHCDFYLYPWLKIPPFWQNWGDGGRIAGSDECSQRTWLPRCILKKMAEALGTMYMCGRLSNIRNILDLCIIVHLEYDDPWALTQQATAQTIGCNSVLKPSSEH
jgi:hypothetical protein